MVERSDDAGVRRMTVFVRGHVQGVGFRWWARARALELGLVGHARNTADGRVEVVAEGGEQALSALLALLHERPSTTGRPGRVDGVSSPLWGDPRGDGGFRER
ncbi:acylphosphatase [Fodinibacter luteus]|uniref:acylphosphatase n=1 Tax=Fodinibacter luteus TaxID=552064 RepID=A0ABP8K6K1_9MICO